VNDLTQYFKIVFHIQILNIPPIHDYGYDGSGVLIAVFDTGFNTDHPAFDKIQILDAYDFVEEDADPYLFGPDAHGTQVLSVLGGYFPGELIGPAHGSSFLLARTENTASETPAEEDNWIAAMEWADSLGADIISASLNYLDFDGTANDYPYSALDGNTATITQAANIAASRGILVVNSIGNEGPADSSLWTPADSPHVLSVGAVTPSREIASFSGRGPTADGRTKPDVVAMGTSVYMMLNDDRFRTGQGTSYSTPQIAGLAALLLQSHPTLMPDSVISIYGTAVDFFKNLDVPIADFPEENVEVETYRIVQGKLVESISLSNTNLIKIVFGRASIDKLPIFNIIRQSPSVWVLTTGEEVVAAEYNNYEIETHKFSTYPLKSIEKAFEELKNGDGSWNKNLVGEVFEIRNVKLGYIENKSTDNYLQPVYVFESDDGLAAFVNAVNDDWISLD